MIVRTSQDAALLSCCPCDMPDCEPPRINCQSISVDACGYILPACEDVPPEELCKLWRKLTVDIHDNTTGTSASGIYTTNTITDKQTVTTREKYSSGSGCGDRIAESQYDITNTHTMTVTATGAAYASWKAISSSNYSIADGCAGTQEQVAISGDVESSPPEAWNNCFYADATVNCETYAGTGPIFTLSESISGGTRDTTITYSLEVDRAMVLSDLDARIAGLEEGEDWPGNDCDSAYLLEQVGECRRPAGARKARYRVGIPDSQRWEAITEEWKEWDNEDPGTRGDEPPKTSFDVAHAAWVDAHAEWVSADPDTRGPEPLEPIKRTVFSCQWDEVFFPTVWDEWKALKDVYDEAVEALEAWEACNAATPGACGDAPEVPEEPDEEPEEQPALIASRSWTYAGEDDYSEFFEIELPEVEGSTRVVNMLVKCFRSSRIGLKPTATGEVWVSDE